MAVQNVDREIGVRDAKLLDKLLRVRLVNAVPKLTATVVDRLDVVRCALSSVLLPLQQRFTYRCDVVERPEATSAGRCARRALRLLIA